MTIQEVATGGNADRDVQKIFRTSPARKIELSTTDHVKNIRDFQRIVNSRRKNMFPDHRLRSSGGRAVVS